MPVIINNFDYLSIVCIDCIADCIARKIPENFSTNFSQLRAKFVAFELISCKISRRDAETELQEYFRRSKTAAAARRRASRLGKSANRESRDSVSGSTASSLLQSEANSEAHSEADSESASDSQMDGRRRRLRLAQSLRETLERIRADISQSPGAMEVYHMESLALECGNHCNWPLSGI
jgi:hypothetical protein